MPYNFKSLKIPEVILIETSVFRDERGYFGEMYKRSVFEEHGISEIFVQDNFSKSHRKVIRGLHFQKSPRQQGKLVSVISGRIFDVAVDIRPESKTFGSYVYAYLDDKSHNMLFIPSGFAHGFCSMEDNTIVNYKTTSEYSPEHERGIKWNEPDVGILWPFKKLLLSNRDSNLPTLSEAIKE